MRLDHHSFPSCLVVTATHSYHVQRQAKKYRSKAICRCSNSNNGLVEQQWLANILYLGYRTLQIEGFRKNNFEDLSEVSAVPLFNKSIMSRISSNLLYVDAVAGTAEDETGAHSLREATSLYPVSKYWKYPRSDTRTWFEISSWSSLGKLTK